MASVGSIQEVKVGSYLVHRLEWYMWHETGMCPRTPAVSFVYQLAGGEAEACRCWGGVQGRLVIALLYADDAVLFAENISE